jgi:hypothetical protein
MGVVFDEVVANVETPREAPPPEAAPAPARPNDSEEIINAVETQQRRARRLQAD